MDMITALAVSIGVLGGVATYIFLAVLPAGFQLWAAFIGWASFYGCGGKTTGLTNSVIANIFGAVCAWVAFILLTKVLAGPLGVPVGASIAVCVTVIVLVLAAKNPMLAAIPSSVYGYASTAALFLLTGAKADSLTEAGMGNPLIAIVLSMIIGNLFGFVSEMVAGQIKTA